MAMTFVARSVRACCESRGLKPLSQPSSQPLSNWPRKAADFDQGFDEGCDEDGLVTGSSWFGKFGMASTGVADNFQPLTVFELLDQFFEAAFHRLDFDAFARWRR
jgi:hypothetical protein